LGNEVIGVHVIIKWSSSYQLPNIPVTQLPKKELDYFIKNS